MFRFRRLTNTPYAAFVSMGKCITIGVLKNYITNLQLRKSHIPADIVLISCPDYEMLYSQPLPQ